MKFKKIVSLFAAATMAVSSFAGLGVTASAASDAYAEWVLTDSYSSTNPAGTDGTLPNGSTAATVMNLSSSSGLTATPALYYSRTPASERANASSSYKGASATISAYSGTSIAASKGFKCSGNANYGYTFVVDPKLADNNAASYDLTIAFWGNSSETILKVVEISDATFGQVNSGTAVGTATSTGSDNLVEYTFENLTQYASFAFNAQPGFAYAGIEYNAATTEPSIKLNSSAETIVAGNSVELTATTENADGVEINWTSDDEGVATVENGLVTGIGEGNTTITAMINVDGVEYTATCAITVVNTATVTFAAGGAEGIAPEAVTANIGEDITLPVNRTLYVNGSTLIGWDDGENTYAPGESYTVNGAATLTAVFEENAVSLGDAATTVAFDLQTKNGTPVVAWQNRAGDILVYQASINGTTIDVKMDVDTKTNGGKLANANWTDWAQVNSGTTFTVPALDGAVVKMDTIYGDATYTINGTEYTQAGQSQGEAVTITGANTIVITAGATSGSYWRGFTVTYPKAESGDGGNDDTAEPVVLKYNSSAIIGGNPCSNTAEYVFVNGVDTNIASFFASSSDSTKLDADLISGYKNYIAGTNEGYDSPSVTADLPAGSYKIYFLGYNHGKEVNATIASTGETVYDTTGGVQFAYQSDSTSRVLKLYTLEFTLDSAVTGETITFDSTVDSWLPDLYAVVLTNQASAPEVAPTPEPDLTDVMPDFAYQFCNTNSTELTSTTTGTYYLDKNGKLQSAASGQTVTIKNVRYHNDHGLSSGGGATYTFRAQAPFKLTVGTCTYDDASGKLVVKDLSGNTLYDSGEVVFPDNCYKANSANSVEFSYTGTGVVEVIFSTPSGGYFPYLAKTSIDVSNVSGTLTGAAGLNEGTLTFTSQKSGIVYTATISNGTYSVALPTGETYDVLLTGCNYINTTTTYTANGDSTSANIACTEAIYQTVSGTIINAPAEAFTLTFTAANNAANTKTVSLAAGATSYSVSLYPDTYTASSSTGTLSPISSESTLVSNAAVTKNLYYPEVIPNATASTVTVYKNQAVSGTNYHTISDAITGLKNGKISNPTILLKSGETYQEQVRVQNLNNLTLKTDGSAKATITWYYGIGYTYYSLGADGYYDKDRAMTKVGKLERDPDRWGAVVRVQSDNFKAENIIFENSFNQRATAAEIADGVVYNGCQAITVDRTVNNFVADTRSATERAAAIAIEGKGVELYNCEFIGSQDTFFTGGTAYVKDCAITGNTDYIFGGGSIVFDNCDLIWGGYSDQEVGGHITASNGSEAGYLFRNCTIKDGNRRKAKGSFGRDWGGESGAHAYFINCTDATEKGVSGWSNMGGAVNAGTADLHVYDFSNPGAYTTAGSKDPYNITKIDFAAAKAKYENVIDMLGFTPDKMTTAITTKEALSNAAADRKDDNGNYVYGVVTTIKQGSDASIDSITWTVKSGNSAYSFSTSDTVDGTNMLNKGTFPTISGEGTAEVAMLFHAQQGTYEVVSQAE